mmetsp:Transcript_56615/g.132001  ORF Transcript_56615/g.132001 Transcript_56615/m.132001 type:complete len:328 (-) Transcript_56615:203-1186(-)
MRCWPLRGRGCQGSGLLVSAALLAGALHAGAVFLASGASSSGPLPQVRHAQGALVSSAPRITALKSSRPATTIPSWLLFGCALTFLQCSSRLSSQSCPRGRRVRAAAFHSEKKQLCVALGHVQHARESPQREGKQGDVPASLPPAPWATVPPSAVRKQMQPPTPQCVATPDHGNLPAPPGAPWVIPPSATPQFHAHVACQTAPSTSSALQSKPRPARFVGRVRYGSCSQSPRSSNTATRATRKQIGSRLQQGKAAKIEVPQLSYDVSRVRTALQVGLRGQHQRRSERPRESRTPSSNGLKDRTSELHTAFQTIFVRNQDQCAHSLKL